MIVDANVGMTDKDISMFDELVARNKDFIIAVSKIDKMNQSEHHHQMTEIKKITGEYPVFPFSTKTMKGLEPILDTLIQN